MEACEVFGRLIQADPGGDHRIDVHFSARDEVQALRVVPLRGAGAEDGELAGDGDLEREVDGRAEVADEGDAPALPDRIEGHVHGWGDAHGFDGDVELFAGSRGGGSVGAEGSGRFQLGGIDIDGDHLVDTLRLQDLDHEEPDHAGADDGDPVAGGDGGTGDPVDGDGDRLDHRRPLVGEALRQAAETSGRHGDVLGECALTAVVAAGDAEHLAVVAQVDLPRTAVAARPAEDSRVEGDPIARVPAFGGGADFDDVAGRLMAHDDGRDAAAGAAVHAVNVAPADAAGADADQHFVGGWFRNG